MSKNKNEMKSCCNCSKYPQTGYCLDIKYFKNEEKECPHFQSKQLQPPKLVEIAIICPQYFPNRKLGVCEYDNDCPDNTTCDKEGNIDVKIDPAKLEKLFVIDREKMRLLLITVIAGYNAEKSMRAMGRDMSDVIGRWTDLIVLENPVTLKQGEGK